MSVILTESFNEIVFLTRHELDILGVEQRSISDLKIFLQKLIGLSFNRAIISTMVYKHDPDIEINQISNYLTRT
jgi:hypothetical protein